MAIRVADRAVLDTNVLLAATDEARTDHDAAVAALNTWPTAGTVLYTSGQILREYLAVATRPAEQNGLGLARPDAVSNASALRARLHLLTENLKVCDRLLRLVEETACAGKQVHDANVVATMMVHGIDTIATFNVADFTRFGEYVRVIRPAGPPLSG